METGLTWKAKPWSQLDRDELHALLRLRIDVFVLEQEWPGLAVRISAQCYLERFYRDLGFVPCGETYLEDGIPHVEMLRPGQR